MPVPNPLAAPASDPSFSWFLTVSPKQQPRVYNVSVVVCYKRVLTQTSGQPDGEQAVDITAADGFLGGGYGGGTVQLAMPLDTNLTHPINRLKDNQWVMLCGWTAGRQRQSVPDPLPVVSGGGREPQQRHARLARLDAQPGRPGLGRHQLPQRHAGGGRRRDRRLQRARCSWITTRFGRSEGVGELGDWD